jgi:uncharacterized protein YicC (UPF0701 family)
VLFDDGRIAVRERRDAEILNAFRGVSPMDQQEMETRIKNIDERTQRIEQILPTLATREEIRTLATKDEVAKLATKEEVATLATREELREEGERTRRHFDVVAEQLRSNIKFIAEGHETLGARADALESEFRTDIAAHDKRLTILEASKRR